MKIIRSINNVSIRLPAERWSHIIEFHENLVERESLIAEVIEYPDIIVVGDRGELLAARQYAEKWLIVIYRELDKIDGFIITAFYTNRLTYILNKRTVWKKQ